MLKKSSFALIVPCYNESESIPAFAKELLKFYNQFKVILPDYTLAIIVIDNNSSDGSLEQLKALTLILDCLVVDSCLVSGYGAALKHGFRMATSDYLSFLDLDNTYPLESLFDLLKMLQNENLDIVYGARIHKASKISFVRYLGNLMYVLLLKYLFNSKLSDVCSGMRVFKSNLKTGVLGIKSNDLSFSIDFTSYALNSRWKISELPIHYRERTGTSKLSVIKDGYLFLYVIINKYLKRIK